MPPFDCRISRRGPSTCHRRMVPCSAVALVSLSVTMRMYQRTVIVRATRDLHARAHTFSLFVLKKIEFIVAFILLQSYEQVSQEHLFACPLVVERMVRSKQNLSSLVRTTSRHQK